MHILNLMLKNGNAIHFNFNFNEYYKRRNPNESERREEQNTAPSQMSLTKLFFLAQNNLEINSENLKVHKLCHHYIKDVPMGERAGVAVL